jgi:low temperature requirement protein LtrA
MTEQTEVPGRRWRVRMAARDIDATGRVATPLELLFDLTFVVAVSQVSAALEHAVADDHVAHGLLGYLMVFFAIWWAWMNFTWFASAYDTDDVPYRLLTLVQMAGVLVLAAGVPAAFDRADFTAVTVGYVLMRVAMVAQWLRAAHGDPARRPTTVRFAAGVLALQVGWLLRLALPPGPAFAGFFVLVALELAVPVWAERQAGTTWHPHHIAERYGLFTIIVLGECVLAATVGVRTAVTDLGWSPTLLVVGAAALVLLFALWWLYFLKPAGEGLAGRRRLGFWWGYGHYLVFASLAALGAGLTVAVEAVSAGVAAPDPVVALAVAVPTAVFLVMVWALHAPLGATPARGGLPVGAAAAATLALGVAPAAGLPLPWAVALLWLPAAALVAHGVSAAHRRST